MEHSSNSDSSKCSRTISRSSPEHICPCYNSIYGPFPSISSLGLTLLPALRNGPDAFPILRIQASPFPKQDSSLMFRVWNTLKLLSCPRSRGKDSTPGHFPKLRQTAALSQPKANLALFCRYKSSCRSNSPNRVSNRTLLISVSRPLLE
jgi:hypothetical protein